jgi:hypothetical protein
MFWWQAVRIGDRSWPDSIMSVMFYLLTCAGNITGNGMGKLSEDFPSTNSKTSPASKIFRKVSTSSGPFIFL